MHYDNAMFYFKFLRSDERQRVLEYNQILINGKPIIIAIWSASIYTTKEHVLFVPVRAYFSHILSILQPMFGIDWLISFIGKVKCFDSSTVARERLVCDKALIEITRDKPLP